MQKLVLIEEKELENFIFDAVNRSFIYNLKNFNLNQLPNKEEDKIGGIEVAMKILGLKKSTIYGLVSKRKIPFMRRNHKLFFSEKELIQWLEDSRQSTVAEIEEEAEKDIQK